MFEHEHPLGAIGFAEARGQKPPAMEVVMRKFDRVNELLARQEPPVEVKYPDKTGFQPDYTENTIIFGGCTE